MFGKQKSSEVTGNSAASEKVVKSPKKGKGRPTPTRKQAEAARRRDAIPADRKLAKKLAKERRDLAWQRQQEALETGDERYLPARDLGPARRFIRNYVDARWSFAEFVLPAMLLMFVAVFAVGLLARYTSAAVAANTLQVVTMGTYGLLLLSIVESIWVVRKSRRLYEEKHPSKPWTRGAWFYTFSRMIMARRWRKPNPQVERGASIK
ncbi:MAG: DUF3043 domain-containing protein [Actinomycetaceae bacterium]|nr:DUF3043 domain-containing protein [Actinomycetaceae bacterium]